MSPEEDRPGVSFLPVEAAGPPNPALTDEFRAKMEGGREGSYTKR